MRSQTEKSISKHDENRIKELQEYIKENCTIDPYYNIGRKWQEYKEKQKKDNI